MTSQPDQPSISIIIPCRDSRETLSKTLRAIADLDPQPDEVLVIDDGSHDPIRISQPGVSVHRLNPGRGPASARNFGANIANGNILLFLDADVLPAGNIISTIKNDFLNNPSITAVQGVYDSFSPFRNCASRYQNYYYRYAFLNIPSDIVAVCATYCFAIRRDVFFESGCFDTNIAKPTVEDEAFGYALHAKGHQILLDRNLSVIHLAEYSTPALIRRKIRMSFNQVKNLLRGNPVPLSGSNTDKNPTHHSKYVLAGVLIAPWVPVGLFFFPFGILPGALYLLLNMGFWRYLLKYEPIRKLPNYMLMTWLDQCAVFVGLGAGTLHFLLGAKY